MMTSGGLLVKIRILMVVVLISAYMFAAPYITANRMMKALRHHDAETLNEYIDFDAVRQGVRRQLQHVLKQPVPEFWRAVILNAIGAEQREMNVDEIIDQAIMAESLTNFLQRLKDQAQLDVPQDLFADISMSWRGLGRFAVTIKRNRAVDFISRTAGVKLATRRCYLATARSLQDDAATQVLVREHT